jgi:predicted RNA binding protein YcfA (HicA-like mRNA interferase family)
MPNRKYISGRNMEYRIINKLKKNNWLTIRSSGSHTPFDIIAIKVEKLEHPNVRFPQFFIRVLFWQSKKGITKSKALNEMVQIYRKLYPLVPKYFIEEFFGKYNIITTRFKDVMVDFGVIYTPPKKKKR